MARRLQSLKPRIQESGSGTGLALTQFGSEKRIRGTTLQNIRKAHFEKYPLCVRCLAKEPPRDSLAMELDHIRPLHQGGTDTPGNRQGLCEACHSEKSITERGHRYRTRVK